VDERRFFAAVAERAALSKEEAADLTRATLEALGGQISGGAVDKLAGSLPDWLAGLLPRHERSAHPVPVSEFVGGLSKHTGLTDEETRRGVRAILAVLREDIEATHLDHALSLLPKDYGLLEAA
jgi:uncharacterized protein (DUF2267 family)